MIAAEIYQLHHQVIVGNTKLPEAAEPRTGVHQEIQKHPALRVENLVGVELGRVRLIDRAHDLLANSRELCLSAKISKYDAGRGERIGVYDVICRPLLAQALDLARMMVKRQMAS